MEEEKTKDLFRSQPKKDSSICEIQLKNFYLNCKHIFFVLFIWELKMEEIKLKLFGIEIYKQFLMVIPFVLPNRGL